MGLHQNLRAVFSFTALINLLVSHTAGFIIHHPGIIKLQPVHHISPKSGRETLSMSMGFGHGGGGADLLAMVRAKKYEVAELQRTEETSLENPSGTNIELRMQYYADQSQYMLKRLLRRNTDIDDPSLLTVIADIKRQSPTALGELPRRIADFSSASNVAGMMVDAGVDAVMVNTDYPGWGGDMLDLETTVESMRKGRNSKRNLLRLHDEVEAGYDRLRRRTREEETEEDKVAEAASQQYWQNRDQLPLPVIMKDLIVDPVQIALGLEAGAHAFYLITAVLGADLEECVDAVTAMGTECIVEVHTLNELEHALSLGVSMICVNNWDRVTGKLYPDQALNLCSALPKEIITLATGGIKTKEQCFELSDAGYDGVILGRALAECKDINKFIGDIKKRKGVPRKFLGWGLRAEDVDWDDLVEMTPENTDSDFSDATADVGAV